MDCLNDAGYLVRTKIVQNDDVTRAARRDKNPPDLGQEDIFVRRSIDGHARGLPIASNRPDQGSDAPMAVWRRVPGTFSAHGAAVQTRHFRRDSGFIDENDFRRIPILRNPFPELPFGRYVRAVLLGGSQRLFLYVRPMRRSVLSTVAMEQESRQAEAISAKVAPGCFAMYLRICSRLVSGTTCLRPTRKYRFPTNPVRLRWLRSFFTNARETPNRSATC